MKKTLFDKVWDSHVVQQVEDGPDILFIDRHMVHEVTSPVAFGLEEQKYTCSLSGTHLCNS